MLGHSGHGNYERRGGLSERGDIGESGMNEIEVMLAAITEVNLEELYERIYTELQVRK